MVGRVNIQSDEIDRRGNDAQVFGRVFRSIAAGLRQECIGVFSFQHHGQIAGIEFARRNLGCADIRRRFDRGNTAYGILGRTDPGPRASVGPHRLHRKTVSQRDVVTDLVQL
jgi:hypothetical protein